MGEREGGTFRPTTTVRTTCSPRGMYEDGRGFYYLDVEQKKLFFLLLPLYSFGKDEVRRVRTGGIDRGKHFVYFRWEVNARKHTLFSPPKNNKLTTWLYTKKIFLCLCFSVCNEDRCQPHSSFFWDLSPRTSCFGHLPLLHPPAKCFSSLLLLERRRCDDALF